MRKINKIEAISLLKRKGFTVFGDDGINRLQFLLDGPEFDIKHEVYSELPALDFECNLSARDIIISFLADRGIVVGEPSSVKIEELYEIAKIKLDCSQLEVENVKKDAKALKCLTDYYKENPIGSKKSFNIKKSIEHLTIRVKTQQKQIVVDKIFNPNS